jgi:hypothetical protein
MLLVQIIEHTPPYVWVALALICLRMARNLRTRWLSLQALLFPAAAFILVGIVGSSVQSTADAIGWAVAACVAGPIGFFTAPHPLAIDRTQGRLQIRGSVLFATRLLVIFLVRPVRWLLCRLERLPAARLPSRAQAGFRGAHAG